MSDALTHYCFIFFAVQQENIFCFIPFSTFLILFCPLPLPFLPLLTFCFPLCLRMILFVIKLRGFILSFFFFFYSNEKKLKWYQHCVLGKEKKDSWVEILHEWNPKKEFFKIINWILKKKKTFAMTLSMLSFLKIILKLIIQLSLKIFYDLLVLFLLKERGKSCRELILNQNVHFRQLLIDFKYWSSNWPMAC